VSDERRAFYRVMAQLPVSALAVDEQGGARLLRVQSTDLSAGGMRLRSTDLLELGQVVRVSFQAGDPPEVIKLDARVVYAEQRPDGDGVYGLEFPELDMASEHKLVRAVFAQERANAGHQGQVRMTISESVACTTPQGVELTAYATAISASDLCLVCRHPFAAGDRVRVSMRADQLGVDLDAWASVAESGPHRSGGRACTLVFDDLDRVARAALLRIVMESERRRLADG
jgi:c-di-GMP-binding flagellar brake protein YcgR